MNTAFASVAKSPVISKTFFIVKSVCIVVVAVAFQVKASTYAQITIHKKDALLGDVLKEISKQTEYQFLFNNQMLTGTHPVTLELTQASLEQVLQKTLKGQPLSYQMVDKTIVLKRSDGKKVAPSFDVRGVVKDSAGAALPGVTVKIKGTSIATITNKDGRFTIGVSDKNTVLVFNLIGYNSLEKVLTSTEDLSITLREKTTNLAEVVVVQAGYGTQLRRDLTGSIGSVTMADLEKAPVKSFDDALAGRVAGVQVSSPDGQPGSNADIVIRGASSLTQDNSPLYVIDGFPIENPNNNAVSPSDIESIEVLKDASSTAIYGARGANGVIIITTKKGKLGQTVTYDGFYGFSQRRKRQEVLSPYEFIKLQSEIFPVQTADVYFRDGNTLESYRNAGGIQWQDRLIQTAPFQNHSLAVRGGSDKSTYSISANYVDQKGVIIKSGFKRYQGRIVLTNKFSNKFRSEVNVNYTNTLQYGTRFANYGGQDKSFAILASAWGYRPVTSGGNEDILLEDLDEAVSSVQDYRVNPLQQVQNEINSTNVNVLTANGALFYKLTPSLTLKVQEGLTYDVSTTSRFNNSNTRTGNRKTPQGIYGPNGSIITTNVTNYLNENTLTYRRLFSRNHAVDLLAGFTTQRRSTNSYGFAANNVPNENLGLGGLNEGAALNITPNLVNSSYTLASFLGRANYNYRAKYYGTFSFRADGSSKFFPGNRWGYFPSGALAWRVSEEGFMKRQRLISDLKLRATYGITGNNRVTDFPYLSTIRIIPGYYTFNNQYNQGANITTLGNRSLRETTAQYDLGLDLGLFRGRINAVVDYYNKKTTDLLLNTALPGSTGFASAFSNIGKVRNKGLEFTLTSTNVAGKNFKWNSNFNISFNRSKVLELAKGQESLLSTVAWDATSYNSVPGYITKIGQPVGQLYGYVFDGLYPFSDFYQANDGTYILKDNVPNNGGSRGNIKPGNAKYKDLNGDGVVDSQDQTVIGRSTPIHTGGFSNNFVYKNIDLNVFFQWSYGNDLLNANRILFESPTKLFLNQFASVANRWTPTNQNTNIAYDKGTNGPANFYSSRVIEDGSYLRLKTVQLGYNFPVKNLRKLGLSKLRLYVSGQNLLTWTHYSGIDPEVSTYNSALTPGFDYSPYPRAQTFTFGLSAGL